MQGRNFWPVDFILDESVVIGTGADMQGLKALIQSSENASDDSDFNQWCPKGVFAKQFAILDEQVFAAVKAVVGTW